MMKIAIGIPTCARTDLFIKVLGRLEKQSRTADAIFICPTSDSDVEGVEFDGKYLIRVESDKGLTKQRNAILQKVRDFDLIVFFDDDFVVHMDYIKNIEKEFIEHKETVIATGYVIADGAKNEGINFNDAVIKTDNFTVSNYGRKEVSRIYGCNMSIRIETFHKNGLSFDEQLPFYSWLEDLDMATRMLKYGKAVKISDASGTHMGYKIGRTSGIRYGYSQVANPLHITKKENGFTYPMAIKMFTKSITVNLVKSFFPESYIDRFGRLKGNFLAIKDLLNGKLNPRRIESL